MAVDYFSELTSGNVNSLDVTDEKAFIDSNGKKGLEPRALDKIERESYVENFNNAIANMRLTKKGEELYQEWKKSGIRPNMHIPQNSILHASTGENQDGTKYIVWNPQLGLHTTNNKGDDLGTLSPTSILLHEIAHLMDKKMREHENQSSSDDSIWRNKAEEIAVNAANEYRREIGEIERERYISIDGGRFPQQNLGVSQSLGYEYIYDKDGNVIRKIAVGTVIHREDEKNARGRSIVSVTKNPVVINPDNKEENIQTKYGIISRRLYDENNNLIESDIIIGDLENRDNTIELNTKHKEGKTDLILPENLKGILNDIASKIPPFFKNPKNWKAIAVVMTGNWFGLFRDMLIRLHDPLTLDLDGDGIETLASNGHKGALFDHDKDGIRTATGWVSKDDGLLVYDRNGDGVVNDGSELFGDNTLLKNGERAANGYQALADLDDNGDGKVDAADNAFAHLRVWRDRNQDGISQEGELLTLEEAKVKALNLTHKNGNRDLGNGNTLAEEGTYTDSDGNEKQMGDLNLAADHFHSRFSDSVPLTDEQQQAPNLRGSGRVRDLREAAARSPELAEALQQYKNAATKEEQLTLRHENTAMTPGKPCHEYAEKDRLKALQGCNKSLQFPQNTTQTPHNNTWICRNNQHSRTSHDKPTDQYRPQAAASCSVSCLWYCPTLGLQ